MDLLRAVLPRGTQRRITAAAETAGTVLPVHADLGAEQVLLPLEEAGLPVLEIVLRSLHHGARGDGAVGDAEGPLGRDGGRAAPSALPAVESVGKAGVELAGRAGRAVGGVEVLVDEDRGAVLQPALAVGGGGGGIDLDLFDGTGAIGSKAPGGGGIGRLGGSEVVGIGGRGEGTGVGRRGVNVLEMEPGGTFPTVGGISVNVELATGHDDGLVAHGTTDIVGWVVGTLGPVLLVGHESRLLLAGEDDLEGGVVPRDDLVVLGHQLALHKDVGRRDGHLGVGGDDELAPVGIDEFGARCCIEERDKWFVKNREAMV